MSEQANQFRLEAEENAAKMERRRLEHIAQERGVTVAELLALGETEAPTEGTETLSPRKKAVADVLEAVEHVKESICESNKHAHRH